MEDTKIEDYDYVTYQHSPNGKEKQILHVRSLPPTSVVQSPVKLVLNKTNQNAAWSSPRTKQSFKLQDALLNAMDEDVMVIRRKEIEEAARKQRRENLRALLITIIRGNV